MKASITAEDNQYIGLDTVDNAGVVHDLTIEKSTGDIEYHEQDPYAVDPDDRSPENKKHFGQTRDYARYYVYRERGYDTLDVSENPDRLLQTAMVIGSLSNAAFEEHFGDLYQQLKSEYTDQSPVVDVEDEIRERTFMVYAKEVVLGLDDAELSELATALSEDDVQAYLSEAASLLNDESTGSAGLLEEFAGLTAKYDLEEHATIEDPAQWLQATPTVYPKWRIGTQVHQDPEQLPDLDVEPDCRLEIVPYNPDSLEDLQEYIVQHLKCQIRDCFVAIGVVPPEPFQVQGPGTDFYTMQYQHYDFLQPYHDPEADIDWDAI